MSHESQTVVLEHIELLRLRNFVNVFFNILIAAGFN